MYSSIDYSQRDSAIELSKYILSNIHLQNLSSLPSCPRTCPHMPSYLQLLKLYTSSQYIPLSSSITSLLIGLHSLYVTFCYMIHIDCHEVTTYIGVSHPTNSLASIELLRDGLSAIDSSLSLELIPQSEIPRLLENSLISSSLYTSISSTTFYPPAGPLDEPFTDLIQTSSNASYTILCIGEPMDFTSHLAMQQEILQLSVTLHPFREITHTCTHTSNDSTNNASSHAHHKHETLSCSENTGTNLTSTLTHSSIQNQSLPFKSSDKFSITVGASSTHTENNSDNSNCSKNNSQSTQAVCIQNTSDSNTETQTNTYTTTRKEFNEEVDSIIHHSKEHFNFHRSHLIPPAFQFATYFLAPSIATSVRTASAYMYHFMEATPSNLSHYLNTWDSNNPSFYHVIDSLSHFNHPYFKYPYYKDCISPALPWSSFSIPKMI